MITKEIVAFYESLPAEKQRRFACFIQRMKNDPIFKAIRVHREACLKLEWASRQHRSIEECFAVGSAECEASNEKLTAAMASEAETCDALLKCRPISLFGVVAMLEHLSEPEFLIDRNPDQTGQSVLSGAFERLLDGDKLFSFTRGIAETLRDAISAELQ